MKILLVGGGGREHSLAWKITQSPLVDELVCAPGNAGIEEIARCADVAADDISGLLKLAKKEKVDLTVVGPEMALTLGIVDAFHDEGLKVFGPHRDAAQLEGSKSFSKDLMKHNNIPTAFFSTFTDPEDARRYIQEVGAPIVVKADGLCGGKGVIVCSTVEEALDSVNLMMINQSFGDAGAKVVVEECLQGEEASYLVFTDGKNLLPMPTSQDHKPVLDGDKGPNTGGMGAYSPAPLVTEALEKQILEEVMEPTIRAMAEAGTPYRGVLYAGLMIEDDRVKVLEFNCRFGDPEAQPLLLRMKSDIVPVLLAVADGDLSGVDLEWDPRAAVCVVMAAKGYPKNYKKGLTISGLDKAAEIPDTVVFHAGTKKSGNKVLTSGGRVLGVTSLGDSISGAIDQAYSAVECINWKVVHYRKDIGMKALGHHHKP